MSDVVSLFGMRIDRLRMPEAVARLRSWIDADETRCRYVVTPNVDHAPSLGRRDLHARDAAGRVVGAVVDVRLIEHEADLVGTPAPD